MITNAPYGVEPWCLTENRARPAPDRAERVGVRPVQRAHRAARQPGRGRAARPAWHLPELAVRGQAAAVRGGGLRLPRHGADRHQRDERQDHPAARQRRAVRHQVRHRPVAHQDPRPARGHPDAGTWSWTSPAGNTVEIESVRLVSLTQRAIAAISYRVKPVRRDAAPGGHVRDRRERGDPASPSADPRAAAILGQAAGQRGALRRRRRQPARRPGARHPVEQAAARRRDDARHPRPRQDGHLHRVVRRHGPAARRRRGGAGGGAVPGSSTSATAGPRSGRGPP